jgi:very-short-patch-repair endonuclease
MGPSWRLGLYPHVGFGDLATTSVDRGAEPGAGIAHALDRLPTLPTERRPSTPADDSRSQGVQHAVAGARVFESDQFDEIARTEVDGLPVTTMPETILMLARDVTGSVLTGIFDEAIISGLLDLKAMAATIDREAGRRTPGTPLLRRLTSSRMPSAPTKSSSYLERLFEMILHDPRMPKWTREYEFSLDGETARVDFYVPSARLVLEVDGRNWHARWEDMERDRRRDNALAARGIQVLRFTYAMLISEPERCLEQAIATCHLRAA